MPAYRSASLKNTAGFAARVARWAKKERPASRALIIALKGNLGAGKTAFTRAFVRGFGVKRAVTSPTFVIMKRYPAKERIIFHIDAYRLRSKKELETLGIKKILGDPKNIVLVEWPECVPGLFRGARLIRFAHGKKESARTFYTTIPLSR
jgi:tRNA threonylcarbamoyladenosine biosynthesis protein TsaE